MENLVQSRTNRSQKREPDKGTAFLMNFLMVFVSFALVSSVIAVITVFNENYTTKTMTQPARVELVRKTMIETLNPYISGSPLSNNDLNLLITNGVAQDTINQTVKNLYTNQANPFALEPMDTVLSSFLIKNGLPTAASDEVLDQFHSALTPRLQTPANQARNALNQYTRIIALVALGLTILAVIFTAIHLWATRFNPLMTLWGLSWATLLGSGVGFVAMLVGKSRIIDAVPLSFGVAGRQLAVSFAKVVINSAQLIYGVVTGTALLIIVIIALIRIINRKK
ncbi:MAG: hypothetical protein LBT80_00075 [Lactobacillaceae bacterium]|jgi:hypothetical protein|nr:hypothetical protein [Lactobacillaceae bacterium]